MKETKQNKSISILQKRWKKFKSLKRGYVSLIVIITLYLLSFALPILINSKAVIVRYNGSTYFPVFHGFYDGNTFGQTETGAAEADYRKLNQTFKEDGKGNWVLMPPWTWNPFENDFSSSEAHPQAPSSNHIFGTDNTARDVFARMAYGFNISISFALILTVLSELIGVIVGGVMGYYGGKVDLLGQRFIEIWSNLPAMYVIIIVSSIIIPNFTLLVFLLVAFGWIGITYFIRGEFLREKSKDYVAAAVALGAKDGNIIFKHILPNSLTPLISFFPFNVVGGISGLVGLDFLGFGLPPPTPSWGQMVHEGLQNIEGWWLIVVPLGAMFITLVLITFIGEAIREAFDPRTFSRLR